MLRTIRPRVALCVLVISTITETTKVQIIYVVTTSLLVWNHRVDIENISLYSYFYFIYKITWNET
jgi:phage baseplate assembly protein W